MAIYRFSDTSAIQEIAFRRNDGRPPMALFTAAKDTDPTLLSAIRHAIEDHGWQCVPASADGRDTLQVMGFKTEAECQAFLIDRHFATGIPQIIAEAGDAAALAENSGIKYFLKSHSLQLAGIFNLIGDIGFLGNGIKTHDKFKIAGGSLYTLGGANLALFGGVKRDHDLREVSEAAADFMKQKTGELPEDSGLADVEKHKRKGVPSAKDSLKNNAAENTLGIYTAGAAAMLGSGIRKQADGHGSAGLYYGLSSMIFKLSSFLIPEKNRNDDKDAGLKKGGFSGAIDWIREKPMRLFGYGSMLTDSLLAMDTYQEYKHTPKNNNYRWTAATTVSYLLADFMAAISNKNHANASGKFDAEEQRRVEALAAETIARAPKENQDALIEQVAEFLALRPEMKGDAPEIGKSIREQVAHMAENPWVSRVAAAPTSNQPSIIPG